MLRIHIDRNAGHPSTGRPGFDRLQISSDMQGELDEAIVEAQEHDWQIWTSMPGPAGVPTAVMYKSSDSAPRARSA